MRADQEMFTTLRVVWHLSEPEVVSGHQTSESRTVWRVTAGSRKYSVKVDRQPQVSVLGGVGVQAQVAAWRPGLAPEPLPTVHGKLAATMGLRGITVSEWINGSSPADETDTWGLIGEAAAVLHGLPSVRRAFAVPVELVGEELQRQPSWPRGLVSQVVGRLCHVGREPSSIVHGQLNAANVIERPDRRVTVLDWDEAGTGSSAIDLAYPLICEFLTEDLTWHPKRAEAFFRRYRESATTPLPAPDDVIALGFVLGLRSAMFANQAKRLQRVRYALDRASMIRKSIGW